MKFETFGQWKSEMNEELKKEFCLKFKEEEPLDVVSAIDDRFLQMYASYKMEMTNRKLVWATWALAIGTIILSILTLFLRRA